MKANGIQVVLIASAAFLSGAAATMWLNRASTTAQSPQTPAGRSAERQVNLDVRLPEFNVKSEMLGQVVDDLARKTGDDFAVNWSDTGYGPLPPDTVLPVTLQLRDVTLREALDALVGGLFGSTFPIRYTIKHGVIIFTGSDRGYDMPVTRVYYVRDLIEQQRKAIHQRNVSISKSPAVMGEPAINDYQAAADWVIYVAQRALSQWGGSDLIGTWSELAGRLIVTAPPEAQGRIQQLFDDLRRDPTAGRLKP